jgi:cell division protein FtsZ
MIFDELDSLQIVHTQIKVIGVGGAGKNAINHMIENEVRGVEFYAVNTDAQDLKISRASNRLLIGKTKTHGQGAGADPEVGRAAALEAEDDIHEMIGDAQMVIITCGMGGGTGTGAAPVIARIAREHGCLTVGVCTKPFQFEGPTRMENAVNGLEEIRQYVDTLIVVPNQRLLKTLPKNTSVLAAFREADNVLRKAVQSISETIVLPELINIDFADIRHVMADKGTALLGIGVAKGENRAIEAARLAIHSDLLEVTIENATDAVVNIIASQELSLGEVEAALAEIRNNSGKDLNIIYGTAVNNDLGDEIVITVIATGYELKAKNSGYEDLAEEIFRNMSDTNITYDVEPEVEDTPEDTAQARMSEIFETGMGKKEERRQKREEEKRRKAQIKEQKRLDKTNKHQAQVQESKNDDVEVKPQSTNKPKTPDWLVRK